MKVPVSWLRELVALPESVDTAAIAEALTRAGLEVEAIEHGAAELSGPIVVARVLDFVEEPQKNGKLIRWCRVDCGSHNTDGEDHRGIICGAHNFAPGDLVVAALPGATLPGDFQISARKTYGHISDGMLCAVDELGIGEDHSGILVLDESALPAGWSLGDDAVEVLGVRDDVLDIELTPDLGYCLSMRGVAREVAQAFGVEFRDPVTRELPGPSDAGYPVRLESERCPLFVAVSVQGVDPGARTPDFIQRRLQQCGMRSISLAVDVTNYVMWELGQPLHAYDADTLQGPIVVRQATPGERLTTLDDVERTLDPDDVLITDDAGPIGLAGVMGGARTEITASTTRIVIEAAHFVPGTVARSARRHNLPSEASKRFERAVDPGAAYAAAHRVADLLVEFGGGTVEPGETIAGQIPAPVSVRFDAATPSRVLGAEVAPERVAQVLRASGVTVEGDGEQLTLTPPSWRPDLRDDNDFVEEVGRKIGLDTIAGRELRAPAGRGRTREQTLRRELGRVLAATGLVEVLTVPFVGERDFDALGYAPDDPRRQAVRVHNPLTDEAPLLRTSLLHGLIEAAKRNASRGFGDTALFEIGRVFHQNEASATTPAPLPGVDARPNDDELTQFARSLPDQPRHVAGLFTGAWMAAGWQGDAAPATWATAVASARVAGRVYGAELDATQAATAPFHPGRCAELRVGDVRVGYAGELHPSVVKALGLPPRSAAFELDLETLLAEAPRTGQVGALSTHPVVKEDVALIVADDVPAVEVAETLREGAGELLESLALFDVFTGEQIGEGRKSLAYALRFRAPDRTLKQAEVTAARDAAIALAGQRLGAALRG